MEEQEMVDINELLKIEIGAQIEYLNELEPGTEKHTAAVNDLTKLYNAYNGMLETEGKFQSDMAKLDAEKEQFEKEMELKEKQFQEELKAKEEAEKKEKDASLWDKIFKGGEVVLRAAAILVPLWFYRKMFTTGLKFEETGTIAAQENKWLFSKFKPNKLD